MRIIAVANQKGGCGKTTTAINLAYSLSIRGKKVLLVDCDPQAHATMGLKTKPSDLERSLYDVLTPKDGHKAGIESIIIPINEDLHLAPSSIILSAVEQELAGIEGREDRMQQALQGISDQYAYCIIDCPPSVGLLCFNALRASSEVIIPIDMSLFSLRGIAKLLELTMILKEELGHSITARALITMYDRRTKYSQRVLEKVREEFGGNAFNTIIRYNIRLRETVDYGLPVGLFDKRSNGHIDYEQLAEEIEGLGHAANAARQEGAAPELTQDMLQKTERYIGSVTQQDASEESQTDMEEFLAQSFKSCYPEMIQAMEFGASGGSSEEESELEEYQD
jgi:chromosome partitioning protein